MDERLFATCVLDGVGRYFGGWVLLLGRRVECSVKGGMRGLAGGAVA